VTKSDSSNGAGCAEYGCGLVGIGIAVLAVFVTLGMTLRLSYGIVAGGCLLLSFPAFILGVIGRMLPWAPRICFAFRGVSLYLLGFSVLCLGTAVVLTLRPAGFSHEQQVSVTGDTVGPITIEREGMRVGVEVEQEIDAGSGRRYQRWSFVTVELLNENKEYLSSFGGEFWHYAGYDEGVHWTQDDETYQATLEVLEAGTYYLKIETETNVDFSELDPIRIALVEHARWGDPVPLMAAGYATFFLGVFLLLIGTKIPFGTGRGPLLAPRLVEGAVFEYEGREWTVRRRTHCTYNDWLAEEWTVQSTDVAVKRPRFLEREYEADSNWEEWFWSRPVAMDELLCPADAESEKTVAEYVGTEETVPETVRYEGTDYERALAGRADREGRSFAYWTYEGPGDRSITIEGERLDDLDAVVTESTRAGDIEITDA